MSCNIKCPGKRKREKKGDTAPWVEDTQGGVKNWGGE